MQTYRGPDADIDHFMVGIEMNQDISNRRNQSNKKKREVKLENKQEQ